MASRHSAARPKRAGESFARAHHGVGGSGGGDSKKVKFDVRNPSALAPDADDEQDAVLEADVIDTGAGATKRGAVNLDGYDSDSDNDNIDARAEERHRRKKGGDVDIAKQFDDYDAGNRGASADPKAGGKIVEDDEDEDDDDDDMFAAEDGDEQDGEGAAPAVKPGGKKKKEVHFLDNEKIQGQEMNSRSGGQVRLDDEESSDEEEERELAIAEEGVDEEVGLGGLKRNAPKVEAFNMKQEQEEGRFDEAGNYVRKAADPDAVHDKWLEGVSKKEMRRAAAAHERREAEARRLRMEEDSLLTTDLLKTLILRLEKGETALEALARLGRGQKAKAKAKKVPKWKLKKQSNGGSGMDVDEGNAAAAEDPEQTRIRAGIDAITEAADKLLSRDHADIYDEERELLIRQWRRDTGEEWVEPPAAASPEAADDDDSDEGHGGAKAAGGKMWEFRWTDGRDGGARQGPFDGPTMKAWQDAGYFGEGVEFRPTGEEGWSRVATFA